MVQRSSGGIYKGECMGLSQTMNKFFNEVMFI